MVKMRRMRELEETREVLKEPHGLFIVYALILAILGIALSTSYILMEFIFNWNKFIQLSLLKNHYVHT